MHTCLKQSTVLPCSAMRINSAALNILCSINITPCRRASACVILLMCVCRGAANCCFIKNSITAAVTVTVTKRHGKRNRGQSQSRRGMKEGNKQSVTRRKEVLRHGEFWMESEETEWNMVEKDKGVKYDSVPQKLIKTASECFFKLWSFLNFVLNRPWRRV